MVKGARVSSKQNKSLNFISNMFLRRIRVSSMISRPGGFKSFSLLNSAEHKILIAHKYENVKKCIIFQTQISLECYFSCS